MAKQFPFSTTVASATDSALRAQTTASGMSTKAKSEAPTKTSLEGRSLRDVMNGAPAAFAAPAADPKPSRGLTLSHVMRDGDIDRDRFTATTLADMARKFVAGKRGEPVAPVVAAEEEQPEAQEPTAQPEATKPDPTNTRYERARRAMLAEGLDIEKFDGTRQQAIRHGLKMAGRQAERAKEAAELAAYRSGAKSEGGQGAQRDEQGNLVTAGTDQSPADLDKLLAPLAEYGDEVASAAKGQLKSVLELKDREIAQLRAQAAQSKVESSPEIISALHEARAKVAEMIPAVADDDDFREMVEFIKQTRLDQSPHLQLEGATRTEQAIAVFTAAARALGHESVGVAERASASRPQGAAGRGAVDVGGSSRHEAPTSDPKKVAVQRAMDRLNQMRGGSY